MKNVLILGASGMLGSMILDYFSTLDGYNVSGAVRSEGLRESLQKKYPGVKLIGFSYKPEAGQSAFLAFGKQHWIINATGITKPLIKDDNWEQVETAISVNSLLPHALGRYADSIGCRVLQIATDGVFSGQGGAYHENAEHDPIDVYGKTKSLGETWQPNTHHLRCSIIGPEFKDFKFLIEWFRRQPANAAVNGFTNQTWNGVTTLHFAKLCRGVIDSNLNIGHTLHVVPSGSLSKADILVELAKAYNRTDININRVEAKTSSHRTLSTLYPELNAELWKAAGYGRIPTVAEMIQELAAYQFQQFK
jgi:dTDP-4-dehydrorhamnose reductase